MDVPHVSVVIPILNERPSLEILFEEIATALRGIRYEIVAVDDGSQDGSGEELERLKNLGHPVRPIRLEETAGQSAAVCAGLDAAAGDFVATLDGDGQIDPARLPELIERMAASGCDAVAGMRTQRASGRRKGWQSAVGNGARNLVTGDRVPDSACSLRVARRETWLALPRFNGMHRFFPSLVRQNGGRVEFVPIEERPRRYGRSHYGPLRRAWSGLVDAIGVRWLLRRSVRYAVHQNGRDV